ncbi:MAG: DUF1178 family protein [Rhodospirillales bacterium]|nr:DUF1178 family protein [Rhodospirillales bacterium]
MIVFDVKCGNGHVFEGWFAGTATFEAQAKAGEIACPICSDTHIEKALMAPNVATTKASAKGMNPPSEASTPTSDQVTLAQQKEKAGQMMAMVRAVKEHVEQNFDNVGAKFAEEAKKIHYGEADKRNIYGQATKEQAEELRDEGIEFGELPHLPKLNG